MSAAWRCPCCHFELVADTPELQYYQRIMESGGTIMGGWGICPRCGGRFRVPEAWQGGPAIGRKRFIVPIALVVLVVLLAAVLWLLLG